MNEYVAGAVSGISQTVVGHPFDTLKVIQQTNKSYKLNPQMLFAGIKYPLLSHSFICSFQFGIYEHYRKNYNNFIAGFISGLITSPMVFLWDIGKIKNQTMQTFSLMKIPQQNGLPITMARDSLSLGIYFYSFDKSKEYNLTPFFAGGIAGVTNWTITYPLDVIRSRQLANNSSILTEIKNKNFWNGYNMCLIRAVVVNSVGLSVYDYLRENK